MSDTHELNELRVHLAKLDSLFDSVIDLLKEQNERSKNNAKIVNNNFEVIKERLDILEKRISKLDQSTEKGFEEVKFELVKIQTATGYEDTYKNLKIVSGDKD